MATRTRGDASLTPSETFSAFATRLELSPAGHELLHRCQLASVAIETKDDATLTNFTTWLPTGWKDAEAMLVSCQSLRWVVWAVLHTAVESAFFSTACATCWSLFSAHDIAFAALVRLSWDALPAIFRELDPTKDVDAIFLSALDTMPFSSPRSELMDHIMLRVANPVTRGDMYAATANSLSHQLEVLLGARPSDNDRENSSILDGDDDDDDGTDSSKSQGAECRLKISWWLRWLRESMVQYAPCEPVAEALHDSLTVASKEMSVVKKGGETRVLPRLRSSHLSKLSGAMRRARMGCLEAGARRLSSRNILLPTVSEFEEAFEGKDSEDIVQEETIPAPLIRSDSIHYHPLPETADARSVIASVEGVWLQVDPVQKRLVSGEEERDRIKKEVLTSIRPGTFGITKQSLFWVVSMDITSMEKPPVMRIRFSDVTTHYAGSTGQSSSHYIAVHAGTQQYIFFPFHENEAHELLRGLTDLMGREPIEEDKFVHDVVLERLALCRSQVHQRLIETDGVWLSQASELCVVLKNLTSDTRSQSMYDLERVFHSCRLNKEVARVTVAHLLKQWEEPLTVTTRLRILTILERLVHRAVFNRFDATFKMLMRWASSVEAILDPARSPQIAMLILSLRKQCEDIMKQSITAIPNPAASFEYLEELRKYRDV